MRLTRNGASARPQAELGAVTGQSTRKRVSVLGATGSIGENTLDLIARNPGCAEIVALTANTNAARLAELALQHDAEMAVIGDPDQYQTLKDALAGTKIAVAAGEGAVVEAARAPTDWVMAAIVGAAGLRPAFAAAEQGLALALANKECLVSAGEAFLRAVEAGGSTLLPVDSEHSAAQQAMQGHPQDAIERILLTASGGPFREWTLEQLRQARPEQALKHPNWEMGQKITIDSATLMNKGLELIEAYYLFPVEKAQLGVVVHPQSIVHCLVEYCDGSVLAQMGAPDMRTPIAFALAWPERMCAPTERLDLARIGQLTFEAPDATRFPALRLAHEAMEAGGSAPTVLNAANEIAVAAFLNKRIGFMGIPALIARTLDRAAGEIGTAAPETLDEVLATDQQARQLAQDLLPEVMRAEAG
ncbi:1-deoxy-D-xylulose 5-phosphate reductoisomerase [Dichotomicrobium thermohalophilum]|uniref:1-deoxy-D-xylulose 5-phosphate reductoisomerase n=1 Tax=Dichotomicrobium thermohalophilum TaxID=933063 RepID=A0A397QDV6_9HYPH|nr:1-deoxy-D-xylulose 5-phosphate reductoisomerase [Dichotomicrobium thermohalophilum]